MIISHKYKFIFIKTTKTAGTSIELHLSDCCEDGDIVTPIDPLVAGHRPRHYRGLWNPLPELLDAQSPGRMKTLAQFLSANRFYNHISARKIRRRIPAPVWNGYFKFCVERNPWDKSLSHYHMLKSRYQEALTFDDYFRQGQFCVNYPLYSDDDGTILVDRILRYETLDRELGEVFGQLGIPWQGTLAHSAKSGYRDDRRHWSECYTQSQRETIARVFRREIRLLGYSFEDK